MLIIDKMTLIGVIAFVAISFYLVRLCLSDSKCKTK